MKRLPLQKPQTMVSPSSENSAPKCPIANSLEQNMRWLQERYIRCSDLVYRQFTISGLQELQGAIFYFDGMTNSRVVHDNILQNLLIMMQKMQKIFKNIFLLLNSVYYLQARSP